MKGTMAAIAAKVRPGMSVRDGPRQQGAHDGRDQRRTGRDDDRVPDRRQIAGARVGLDIPDEGEISGLSRKDTSSRISPG